MANSTSGSRPAAKARGTATVLVIFACAPLLGHCGEAEVEPGAQIRIEVAPLQLDGVEEVRYGIKVVTASETVWEQTGLTSTRFGDGKSALSYIGPCDAQGGPHTVALTIENVRAGGRDLVDPTDWINPAPVGRPIARTNVTCVENGDVLVEFDLTVMRNARQGFFDIAVEFDDIFCSAKLDCRAELLHNAAGVRDASIVVAFACTAGENEHTYLYLSDMVLTCDDDSELTAPIVFTMPAAGMQAGQHGAVRGLPGVRDGVFDWAVYQGDEELMSDGKPLEKCYLNRAFGLDRQALVAAGLTHCTLTAMGTASATPLSGNQVPGSDGAYPIVSYAVEVWDRATGLCQSNPLNATGSGVRTRYVTPDTSLGDLMPLTGTFGCGQGDLECPAPAGVTDSIRVSEAGGTLTVVYGNRAPATVTLPEGYSLGAACCADACCLGN